MDTRRHIQLYELSLLKGEIVSTLSVEWRKRFKLLGEYKRKMKEYGITHQEVIKYIESQRP